MNGMVSIKVELGTGQTRELFVKRGSNLRDALLAAELSPYQGYFRTMNCHGLGVCGSCIIKIQENGEWWERRSCQIPCFRDTEIQLISGPAQ
jgi:ferredoxin